MADTRLAVLLAHLQPGAIQLAGAKPGGAQAVPQRTVTPSGPVVIVGGVVLDIQAKPVPGTNVQKGTSVPGQVRQVPGGVARNMADAVSQLMPATMPAPVFISIIGDDAAGTFLTSALRALRLDLSLMLTCPGVPTPCVATVMDRSGEVSAAVADVATVEEHLSPERLAECQGVIQQASLLLAEANLAPRSLEAVCQMAAAARVPIFLEPVSIPKSTRLVSVLHHATFISPNAAELVAIADEVRRRKGLPLLPRPRLSDGGGGQGAVAALLQQLAAFAAVVLEQGTRYVVLTLGSLGASLVSLAEQAAEEPPEPPTPPSYPYGTDGAAAAVGMEQPSTSGRDAAAAAGHAAASPRRRVVEVAHLRALPAEVASVNGAGDTLVAGVVVGLLESHPAVAALAFGMAAAKRAVESHHNVPERLSMDELRTDAFRILATLERHSYALS